jgi:hypothetical protein
MGVLALGALLGCGVAALASAFGSADTAPHLGFAVAGRAPVVLFGNSVNRTRSHCDSDLRDLTGMLTHELGKTVHDISAGGMHSAEHIAYARLLVARRAAQVLVLPAMVGSIDQRSAEGQADRTRIAAYMVLAFAGPTEIMRAFGAPGEPKEAEPGATLDPQGFGPRREALMQVEKNAEACPEQVASNREFMRFMYRKKIGALPRTVSLPPSLHALAREAAAAKITLVLYAPPFATKLLKKEGLLAEVEHEEAYAASLAQAASALPVHFLDLHDALPADAFTDAWCACGHMRQGGRVAVARALAGAINAALAVP